MLFMCRKYVKLCAIFNVLAAMSIRFIVFSSMAPSRMT